VIHTAVTLFLSLLAPSLTSFPASYLQDPITPTPSGFDQASLDAKVAEILPRVEALRGWKFSHDVLAGVTTPDEFIEFAASEFESDYGLEKLEAMGIAYGMFGLIEPGLDLYQTYMDLLRGQVGGFYDPKTKKFYMMSTFNQGGFADIIMAHELTHALDDQRFKLDEMFENALGLNADAEFALRAVIEGSGTSLMNLYTIQGMLQGYLVMDPQETMDMMNAATESLENAPAFLVMSLALPYLEGNKFLTKQSNILAASAMTPKNEDLDYAFKNPPTSSEQVLHPEKYWDEGQRDEPMEVRLPDFATALSAGDLHYGIIGIGLVLALIFMLILIRRNRTLAGVFCFGIIGVSVYMARGGEWQILDHNTVGELGCFVMTAEELPDMATAEGQMSSMISDASSGWGGDSYTLLTAPNGGHLMIWASVWDSPEDCGEFVSAFHMMQDENEFVVQVDEYESAVVIAFADAAGSEWAAQALKMVLPENLVAE
jgi:hypothetical protein